MQIERHIVFWIVVLAVFVGLSVRFRRTAVGGAAGGGRRADTLCRAALPRQPALHRQPAGLTP